MKKNSSIKALLLCAFTLIITVVLIPDSRGGAKDPPLPETVALGTPSIGTASYVIAVGIADFISKYTSIKATAEVGGGSDANTRLLHNRKVQLVMMNSFSAEHAFKGDEQFAKEGKMPVQALIWGNSTLRQPVVRAASGIKTIADFKGKRILAGRIVGADTELVFNALIKVYGVDSKSVKVIPYSKPKEIMDAFKLGTADGAIWPVGVPNPNVMELQETVELRFPSVPKDRWDALLKELGPSWFMETVPAKTYKKQPEDVYVPSILMGLSTLKDFPEEAAYQITKAILSHYNELKLLHPTASDWTAERTLKVFCVPFHPGAVRYYKEIGAWKDEHEKKQKALLGLEKK